MVPLQGSYGSAKLAWALLLWVLYLAHQNFFSVSGDELTLSTQDVKVVVGVNRSIARVSDVFVCATLDWWPPDKCDYGTCSWDHASLLNLDLTNPILHNAVKGLFPVLLRLGGSLQDQVVYNVGDIQRPCHPFVPAPHQLFEYSEGCLNMSRWQALNGFFSETRSQVAFGLNALYGREANRSLPWNSSNTKNFIQFTAKQGYPIYAWELGNELSSSGIGAKLSSSQYADATKELRTIVNDVYSGYTVKPFVVAPDGFFEKNWYRDLLQNTGPQVLNACTYHIYDFGPGKITNDLDSKILDPLFLDNRAAIFFKVSQTLLTYGPWVQAWVGESGGASNSGQPNVSHSFLSSLWYVDQLGMAATFNTQVYCRQSLIGGHYGLLNTTTFHPNPDYYSALLWKELMGTEVLSAVSVGNVYLRAYAHCTKGDTHSIAVALINLSNTTEFNVHIPIHDFTVNHGGAQSPGIRLSVFGDLFSCKSKRKAVELQSKRLEYHLTAATGDLHSHSVLLNGKALEITPDGNLPNLVPAPADKSLPVIVAPTSIVFVTIPDVSAPACLLAGA
ncbi:hypothetical protein O6H91_08G074200 [Diphasiastrum complanatum]|uniref:Uncharacterized protein n=1 Tax=Diphasiastrum complanatum TaxID=34168 RepID=A0ACC2CYV3_DIPCM|nr:hypothetical protein O6H91_08G074200 [Diphasiastrum complanatum]